MAKIFSAQRKTIFGTCKKCHKRIYAWVNTTDLAEARKNPVCKQCAKKSVVLRNTRKIEISKHTPWNRVE